MKSKIVRHVSMSWSRAQKKVDYENIRSVHLFAKQHGVELSTIMIPQDLFVYDQVPLTDLLSPSVGQFLLYPEYKRGHGDVIDPLQFKEVAAYPIATEILKKGKYVILSNSRIVFTDNLEWALHCAWFTGNVSTCLDKRFETDNYLSCWMDKIKMEVDEEYNEFVESKEELPIEIEVKPMAPHRVEDDDAVDGNLYRHFCESMDFLLENKDPSARYFDKMGNTKSKSAVYHPSYSAATLVYKDKRALTPAQWLQTSPKVCVIAAQFPKIGSRKSDGTARMVAAPHPTLEAWQRRFWNGVTPKAFPQYVRRPEDINPDFKYSYDIRNEDDMAGPYFRRWLREFHPSDENKHMPKVVYKGRVYSTKAVPSGVVHTAIVANAFSHALARRMGCKEFQIQGDGILTNRPCGFKDHLRRCEDYTLNGFKREGDRYEFINTHKLTESQYVRDKGLTGKHRYAVRHAAYMLLNARGILDMTDDCNNYRIPIPVVELTAEQIQGYVQKYGHSLGRVERMAFQGFLSAGCKENSEQAVFGDPRSVCNLKTSCWE